MKQTVYFFTHTQFLFLESVCISKCIPVAVKRTSVNVPSPSFDSLKETVRAEKAKLSLSFSEVSHVCLVLSFEGVKCLLFSLNSLQNVSTFFVASQRTTVVIRLAISKLFLA